MKSVLDKVTRRLLYFAVLLLFLLQAPAAKAQYNNVWVFGKGGGLNFNTGSVQQFSAAGEMRGNSASICDRTGNLLFYTDGNYVWNRQHNLMPGGVNITVGPGQPVKVPDPGNGWMADATAIAMKPGDPGKYYIFSERREPIDPNSMSSLTYPADLYYSIVDMSLSNGFGEVTEKGVMIDSNVQKLTLVAGNDCNIWLVSHQGIGNAYKAYNVTEQGIEPPVVSVTGSVLGDIEVAGTLICSPDRTKIVLTNILATSGQISAFDPATGIVSGTQDLPGFWPVLTPPNYPMGGLSLWQGAAFSPDNTKLYLSSFGGYLAQFDLTVSPLSGIMLGQIYNGTALIGLVKSSFIMDATLKTAPDGKIYFHYEKTLENGTMFPTYIYNDNSLGVIHQPNVAGAGCNVSLTPVYTMTQPPFGASLTYFPNETGILAVADTTGMKQELCFRESMVLLPADTAGYSYVWSEGSDGNKLPVSYTGTFTVSYFTHAPCVYHVDTFIVQRANFDFDLGADTTICHTPPYELGIMVPAATYRWQDGSTGNNFSANASGSYKIAVTKNGCTLADSIQLTFIDLRQNLGNDILFCDGEQIALTLNARETDNATILWSTGSTQPGIKVNDTGTYWVQLSASVCKGGDTVVIAYDPLCYCHFSMPNAFSPNGDGLNDVFLPVISARCPVSAYSLNVFNRWGQRVFNSAKAERGWDGTFNGMPSEAGTYMYQIRFEGGTQKQTYTQKGDLVLLR